MLPLLFFSLFLLLQLLLFFVLLLFLFFLSTHPWTPGVRGFAPK